MKNNIIRMRTTRIIPHAVACLLLTSVTPAAPVPVPIINPSFESDVVPMCTWSEGQILGWEWDTGRSGVEDNCHLPPPDGEQSLWIHQGSVTQVLPTTAVPGATYTMRVWIGHDPSSFFPDYRLHLWAGNEVLIGVDTPVLPGGGDWIEAVQQVICPPDLTHDLPLRVGVTSLWINDSHEMEVDWFRLEIDLCPADLAEPFGLLDLADVNTFVSGFVTLNPIADLNADGLVDLADVNAFVSSFLTGCP